MRLFKKNKNGLWSGIFKKKYPCKFISENFIDNVEDDLKVRYGKEFCLDIGAGDIKDECYQTLDMKEECNPDYLGDAMTLFAPGHLERIVKYPDLVNLPCDSYWKHIRMRHFIEHIPWIYTHNMFKWVYQALKPGGMFSFATPNIEYILKLGLSNIDLIDQNKDGEVNFPRWEHPFLDKREPYGEVAWDIVRWINFKLYSGGSPGDHHYASYDKRFMSFALTHAGFKNIHIHDGYTLKGLAYKPASGSDEFSEQFSDRAVKRELGRHE